MRAWCVSIRPEGRGVLQRCVRWLTARSNKSQSVPRDGGYCNGAKTKHYAECFMSQSVPRDGGYCNYSFDAVVDAPPEVSIRPEGRGVLQRDRELAELTAYNSLNPSRGTGGTATEGGIDREDPNAVSQSVPRDGGYCNWRSRRRPSARRRSQSVPRDGGYCNLLSHR